MDDMELDGTPAKQPEDPFKGDASVTAEKPQDPFGGDEAVAAEQPAPAQSEQFAQTEPAAAEAVAEEKPKWIKIVELVSVICITAAGLLAALFMCLLSINSRGVDLMLSNIGANLANVAEEITAAGSFVNMEEEVAEMFVNLYAFFAMLGGIIAGLIFGIILIVKLVNKYALKKHVAFEKTAISAVLFFFAFAVVLLSLVISSRQVNSTKSGMEYGSATLAGLIICGILFAAYFICKIALNYKTYLADKTKLINGCMNLGWAVIAMLVLALLSCAPICGVASNGSVKVTVCTGFNQVCSEAMGDIVGYGDANVPDEIMSSLVKRFLFGGLGMILQIWFIFQTGKSLHGAMRGTVSADKTVKLGSQIWRLVFAVLYLIISIILTKDQVQNTAYSVNVAAPIVILIFAVIGLVLAIVNKILVKEQANKKEI